MLSGQAQSPKVMYRGTISVYTAVDKANILNEFFYSIFSADQETPRS